MHGEKEVTHGAHGVGGAVDRYFNRVLQVTAHEVAHLAIERCREQHGLVFAGHMAQYPFHLRGETVVGHAVGFVENGNRDFVEADFVGLHEVDEAQWCGNDELNTFFEFFNLLVARGTAIHRKHFHAAGFGYGVENFGNLQCEFTSRNEHQAVRKTRSSIFCNA